MTKLQFKAMLAFGGAGLLFALGMCMALLPEWGLRTPGYVATGAGVIALVIAFVWWRRASGRGVLELPSGKGVLEAVCGTVGVLMFGGGMVLIMEFDLIIPGILLGVAGIAVCACLIPLFHGFKD